jgi:putative YhgA-like transposase
MTTPADLLPRDTIDRLLRDSMCHPAHLRSFLRQVVPNLADGFDYDRARLLDRSFLLEDWRERESDLPFEIPYRLGAQELWALVCILIEHQSDTDPLMPLRMFTYAGLYWDRCWRAWQNLPVPRPSLLLPPVLPIVFYTGAVPWGSNRRLADLLGEPRAFHTFAPTFEPIFWNLADRTAETLLETGEDWLQLLAILRSSRDDRERFETICQQALRHLEGLAQRDKPRWDELLRMALTLALFRRPPQERAGLVQLARDSQANQARQKEVGDMAQTIAESLVEEGLEKGKVIGQLATYRQVLRDVLEVRFGSLPPPLSEQIDAIADIARLRDLNKQAARIDRLEDFKL